MFQIGFCMEPPSPGNVRILREMVFIFEATALACPDELLLASTHVCVVICPDQAGGGMKLLTTLQFHFHFHDIETVF